jgi:hypothetical protein
VSEVRDAGVTKFTVAEVAEAFVEGTMNEYKAMLLKNEKEVQINTFKILAGLKHEQYAAKGIKIALTKFQC